MKARIRLVLFGIGALALSAILSGCILVDGGHGGYHHGHDHGPHHWHR
jgi:hypothetical protein